MKTVTKIAPFYFVRLLAGLLYLSGIAIMLYNFAMSVAASRAARADLSDTKASSPRYYDADLKKDGDSHGWHHALEGKALQFSVFTMLAVMVGGLFEVLPLVTAAPTDPRLSAIHPYTPLELEGRDIYIREGCYTCHSQMIRPFRDEEVRLMMLHELKSSLVNRPKRLFRSYARSRLRCRMWRLRVRLSP